MTITPALRSDSTKLAEVVRHGPGIVRDENSPIPSGESQDVAIVESLELCDFGGAEVHAGGATNQRGNDDLIEVGVRLEADHRQEATAVRRAAATFW